MWFVVVLMVPAAVLIARWAWHTQHRAAAVLEAVQQRQWSEMTRVRITAVVVAHRSLLVGTTTVDRGDDQPARGDQVIVGHLCDTDDEATVAVLNTWREAGTKVNVHMGVDHLIFEAPRGSSIVLATAG